MPAFLKNRQSPSAGFTLIELLVVIVIISILATLLMVNFVGVRQRGRDAQRKSDLRQWQIALELYRADNGTYPSSIALGCGATWNPNGVTYVQKIPCDPLGTSQTYMSGGAYLYTPLNSNLQYILAACIENASDADSNITTTAPTGSGGTCSTGKYYRLDNP